MTRITPFFAASAIVAILTLGAGAASAATTGNNGHSGSPSGPSGPSGASGTGGGAMLPRGETCAIRADQMNLARPAWQAFVNHCQQAGG